MLQEYAEFYNTERPHSVIGRLPPARNGPYSTDGEIKCRERLGGLLKHYYREAARLHDSNRFEQLQPALYVRVSPSNHCQFDPLRHRRQSIWIAHGG